MTLNNVVAEFKESSAHFIATIEHAYEKGVALKKESAELTGRLDSQRGTNQLLRTRIEAQHTSIGVLSLKITELEQNSIKLNGALADAQLEAYELEAKNAELTCWNNQQGKMLQECAYGDIVKTKCELAETREELGAARTYIGLLEWKIKSINALAGTR